MFVHEQILPTSVLTSAPLQTLQVFTRYLTKRNLGEITARLLLRRFACAVQAALLSQASFPSSNDLCSKVPCNSQKALVQATKPLLVRQENVMKAKVWTRPEVKEIHLGCEINSYAPAEI